MEPKGEGYSPPCFRRGLAVTKLIHKEPPKQTGTLSRGDTIESDETQKVSDNIHSGHRKTKNKAKTTQDLQTPG